MRLKRKHLLEGHLLRNALPALLRVVQAVGSRIGTLNGALVNGTKD